MKQKYVAIILVLTLFICFGCISAAAASEQNEQSQCENESQKINERYEAILDRFNKLSNTQKDQIYKLNDKVIKQAETLIQKYVELGVLSQEESTLFIKHLNDKNAEAQKEGKPVGIPYPQRKCGPKTVNR